jgi:C-terminal processing protease CtpA/Prc
VAEKWVVRTGNERWKFQEPFFDEEVLGQKCGQKSGLIVDTRFNGGGWLHEDLSNFF